MTIHVGTSGWHYQHWQSVYYPADLSPAEWLNCYARDFSCVEVNSTFYRLPDRSTVVDWLAATPAQFRFAIKASRYITHQKKLKDCQIPLGKLFKVLDLFTDKLGPVLFQLPPHWQLDLMQLRAFLQQLPAGSQIAMEFRDPSWHCQSVWDLLAGYGIAWCEFDLAGVRSTSRLTAQFAYWRLHGPGPGAYRGSYSTRKLQGQAARLCKLEDRGIDSWVFFDNDTAGHAVSNARTLQQLCSDRMEMKPR